MTPASPAIATDPPAVAVHHAHGAAPLVLVCEHASAALPERYAGLGLAEHDQLRHIAWDIGALELARLLAVELDAPLVHATQSRLLLDLNRHPEAHDSIVEHSEDTPIPGNQGLPPTEREYRRQWLYEPFHRTLAQVLEQRLAAGQRPALISIHSFTPVYRGQPRPWQVGVLAATDRRLAEPLLHRLRTDPELCVGDNQPYAPVDGVCHTMDEHAETRGLHYVMLEIRNDLIAETHGQRHWANRLAAELRPLLATIQHVAG